MFALVFRFPVGRYHATPWGRHVNEGAVAWPPEPYRVLRALIATWHRKADQTRWSQSALHKLIEALASSPPVYRLPDAVHSHIRHYMPQGELKGGDARTALVFDAFYRVDPEDELWTAWRELTLDAEDFALADYLAGLLGYLGRAESIVNARATDTLIGEFPVAPDAPVLQGWATADVLVPLSAASYGEARPGLLAKNYDKPKSKSRAAFEATLPIRLTDALQVETSELQSVGWSRPPAGRMVSYSRPEIGPRPLVYKRQTREDSSSRFQVARFLIAGRPLPPITDSVKIGEVFRHALMSRVQESVPSVLSGRDECGVLLRDPQHSHAFFLPEDHDQDGFIDHLVLYARAGLPRSVRQAAERLRELWIERRKGDNLDDEHDNGRREWRVALEGFGTVSEFSDSALLRPSRTWSSATPYLRPRHLKGRAAPMDETCQMIQDECIRRGWPLPEIQRDEHNSARDKSIQSGGRTYNVLAFHRFRGRRGLIQPDRTGLAVRLHFPGPILGPLALGFACHFGLGLFRAE